MFGKCFCQIPANSIWSLDSWATLSPSYLISISMRLELNELNDADKRTLRMSTDCYLLSAYLTKWVIGSRAANVAPVFKAAWIKSGPDQKAKWPQTAADVMAFLWAVTLFRWDQLPVLQCWEYFPNFLSTKNKNPKQAKVEKKHVFLFKL